jgi:hypothetical protein
MNRRHALTASNDVLRRIKLVAIYNAPGIKSYNPFKNKHIQKNQEKAPTIKIPTRVL